MLETRILTLQKASEIICNDHGDIVAHADNMSDQFRYYDKLGTYFGTIIQFDYRHCLSCIWVQF